MKDPQIIILFALALGVMVACNPRKEEKKEEKIKEVALSKDQELLTEIRDLLKKTKK